MTFITYVDTLTQVVDAANIVVVACRAGSRNDTKNKVKVMD